MRQFLRLSPFRSISISISSLVSLYSNDETDRKHETSTRDSSTNFFFWSARRGRRRDDESMNDEWKERRRERERETKGEERREREKEGGVFPTWRLNVWHDCEQVQVGTPRRAAPLGLGKGERASRRSTSRGRSMTSHEFASNYRVPATLALSISLPRSFFSFLVFISYVRFCHWLPQLVVSVGCFVFLFYWGLGLRKEKNCEK